MVALGGTSSDLELLRYAHFVAESLGATRLHLIHVIALPYELFHGISPEHLDLMTKIRREDFVDLMKTKILPQVPAQDGIHREFQILEESSELSGLLRFVKDNDIDLVIVGQNPSPENPSRLCHKLVQKSPCSVLTVPFQFPAKIERVIVPTDFSKYSRNALEVGVSLCSQLNLNQLCALHVFGLSLIDESDESVRETAIRNMKLSSTAQFSNFLENLDTQGLTIEQLDHLDPNIGRGIQFIAREWDSDFLIVGSRGRTAMAALLIGSITEYLIYKSHIPVLAVKEKGEGMSILNALFGFES